MVRICVLGTLAAEVDGSPVALGGPRQRSVLGRLVVSGCHVVSTDQFLDDLWAGEPPPKGLAALQAYVSHLRRALEPGRAPRMPPEVLVSAAPGYALRLEPEAVDAWRFERLVQAATGGVDPASSLRLLEEALRLWRGPAFAEFADEPWARPEATRLDELRLVAVEGRARAQLELGLAAPAVPDLEQHVGLHPLREDAVGLLALALYRSGRQGDALEALRLARKRLADELGIDPGPALRRLEADVLAHAEHLGGPGPRDRASAPGQTTSAPATSAPTPAVVAAEVVGRQAELARLRAAADEALGGGCRLGWVGGEPGAGKTTLVEHLLGQLRREGWRTALGRCPEVDGAPLGWAWSEVLRGLARTDPPAPDVAARLAPLLHDPGDGAGAGPLTPADGRGAQFWLGRAAAAYLGSLAGTAPLVIVLDDLHRADSDTLQLLRHLVTALEEEPMLVVGTYRREEAGDELVTTWSALTARTADRFELTGLGAQDVSTLLARHGGGQVDDATLRLVTERTGGNPLFVRETARLVASEGTAAAGRIPAGIRDVLRRRVARLPEPTQLVLRHAAVLGREVDIDLLLAVESASEDTVLDALEAGVVTGLLDEPSSGRVRFTHALVRDTLYDELPLLRRARVHGRIAETLERVRPHDSAALAHHALAAATPATAQRTVEHAARAARAATARNAHQEAAGLWDGALAAYQLAPTGDTELLEILCAAVSAHAHAGNTVAARVARAKAVDVARSTGDVRLMTRALTAWDAPVLWSIREDRAVDTQLVNVIEETLASLSPADEADRCRLLVQLTFELENGWQAERVEQVSATALAIARSCGDPRLICAALNARYFVTLEPGRGDELETIGNELLEAATAAGLVGYQTQAHQTLLLAAVHGKHIDLDLAQRHADCAVERATSGQLGFALSVCAIFGAMRALVHGRLDEAESTYTRVAQSMAASGAVNARALGILGRFVVRHAQGRVHELVDEIAPMYDRMPAEVAEPLALSLAAAGRTADARRFWNPDVPVRRDYYWLLWTALRAEVAVRLGDLAVAARSYQELLPWAGRLAGVASGSMTIGPVDLTLGDLADALGRPGDAREHYAAAREVAERLAAPHWAARASGRLTALATV